MAGSLEDILWKVGVKYVLPEVLKPLADRLGINIADFMDVADEEPATNSDGPTPQRDLQEVKAKDGAVTTIIGTRETGKTGLSHRLAEIWERPVYSVSPEEKPPPWIERVTLAEIWTKVKPRSTLIIEDLPAVASNRDYNNPLVQLLEQLIPLCRHEMQLQLIFCTQSSAQADRYISDCDLAFFKPQGLLMADVERPKIQRIYRLEVNPAFNGQSQEFVRSHAYMIGRYFRGLIQVSRVPRDGPQIIEGEIIRETTEDS